MRPQSLADVAQLVEHSLGKGEVTSSILVIGSSLGSCFRFRIYSRGTGTHGEREI